MSKWRIDWTSYDCGYEIIDAETRDEALKKFRDIPFEELLHGREQYGEITRVTEEMKNTGLVAVHGDSVVRILRVEFDASNMSLKRAFCKRDDGGERQFWAKIHRGNHDNDYIMSRGQRHYLMREQEARK